MVGQLGHVAARGRTVPATFTLAVMPTYDWTCLACGKSNAASGSACAACGCPAGATFSQIEAARRASGAAEGCAAAEVEASDQKVLAYALAVGVVMFAGLLIKYAPSFWMKGLGVLLALGSTTVLVRLR
jgi:hypothetical protein